MSYPQNSKFIKLATEEYPKFEGDIRREHPEILETDTWPNFPCPPTYAVVPYEAPPAFDGETHCAIEKSPMLVDGQWKIQWEVRPLTQEELDSHARIRAELAAQEQAFLDAIARAQAAGQPSADLQVTDVNIETTVTPINP